VRWPFLQEALVQAVSDRSHKVRKEKTRKEKKRKEKKRKEKKRKEKKRKEKKRKEKTTPFGVNSRRSQVSCRATVVHKVRPLHTACRKHSKAALQCGFFIFLFVPLLWEPN